MATKIILVRHSHTNESLEKRYAGHLDSPLNELGRAEAARVLRPFFENERVDAAYSSDLKRALETAEIALNGGGPRLPSASPRGERREASASVVKMPALREINCGEWEGMTFEEITRADEARYRRWVDDIENIAPPGGETLTELSARVVAAMEGIIEAHRGGTAAIFSHGGPLGIFLCRLRGLPQREMWNNLPPHASATEVTLGDDGILNWRKAAGW